MREKRRWERVRVSKNLAGLAGSFAASIAWPNHETSEVADLSYKGMAVARPGIFPIGIQQKVAVEVVLGLMRPFIAQARIAWCNADWVGLEFSSLPPEGHAAMGEFLEAKLKGTGMKPIEREFVAGGEDFQYWYQGPEQTHVYVWMGPAQVERVRVDMAGAVSEFARGQSQLNLNAQERRALLVLSQMDKDGLPMEEFVRSLFTGA